MLVAGYIVLVFPEETTERSIMYGTFDTLENALSGANLLSGIVTVHPVYSPTHIKG